MILGHILRETIPNSDQMPEALVECRNLTLHLRKVLDRFLSGSFYFRRDLHLRSLREGNRLLELDRAVFDVSSCSGSP